LGGSTILSGPNPGAQNPAAVLSVLAASIARASVHLGFTLIVEAKVGACPISSNSATQAKNRFQFL